MLDIDKLVSDAGNAAIAMVSGIIAVALRKEAQDWKDYLIRIAGAALVGFLTAKLCRIAGASEDFSYILSSLAGWMGAEPVMNGFRSKFAEKLGVEESQK